MKLATTILIFTMLISLTSSYSAAQQPTKPSYQQEIEQWRQEIENSLKAENGWLSVTGLYWLKEGANSFGSDTSNDFVLPVGSAPAHVGDFEFHQGQTTLYIKDGISVTANDNNTPVTKMLMNPDTSNSPDTIALGVLTMKVIKRGERYGIRLKDNNSKERKEFKGLNWYPIQLSYRIEAKFVPYDPPKDLPILDVLGSITVVKCPGYLAFTIGDKEYHLDAQSQGDVFFINFRDLTSGKTTYPAGRFLYTDPLKDGKVIIDFNKAYNPPCAFTSYATCPLPPKQNYMQISIEAGELNYHHIEQTEK